MSEEADLREIVGILQEAGFGTLAGELLVSLGERRRRAPAADGEQEGGANRRTRKPQSEAVTPYKSDMEFALDFIETRLVLPARAMAEAERLVGELVEGPAAAVRFVEPSTGEVALTRGEAQPGSAAMADKLQGVLARIRLE